MTFQRAKPTARTTTVISAISRGMRLVPPPSLLGWGALGRCGPDGLPEPPPPILTTVAIAALLRRRARPPGPRDSTCLLIYSAPPAGSFLPAAPADRISATSSTT